VAEPTPKPAARIAETPKPASKKTKMTVKKPKVVEEQVIEDVKVEEVEALSIFTVVDSVNIRSKPGRNGAILERVIKNGTEMYYVGEKTKNIQKIRIGEVDYNEPWLKVRTPQGRTGWVYGGTVRFYKR
jgi:SH3-like domain-containing protein